MSSSEESLSDSEESCEEAGLSAELTKQVDCRETDSSSESDNEPKASTSVIKKVKRNKSIGASNISVEDSENSGQESESSASIKNAKAVCSSQAVSSSKSESFSQLPRKQISESESSDAESQNLESVSPRIQHKKNNKVGGSGNESDCSDKSSSSDQGHLYSKDLKKECPSISSKSESEDSDSESPEVKGFLNDTESAPSPGKPGFSFSDENLIKYSSGIVHIENLSTNNDFWLVHCPKIISDTELHGAEINFATESRLKIGGHRLQTSIYPEKGTVGCVLPSYQQKQYYIVSLPVKGSVVFEESVKLPKPVAPEMKTEMCVKFPSKLKERHPLFGADYHKRLRKVSELRRLLNKSKKRKSKDKNRSLNESLIAASGLLKPKVEKESEDTEVSDPKEKDSSLEPSRKSRKKSSVDNSVLNGESCWEEPKKRKRKRDKLGIDVGYAGIDETPESGKVKKRKVRAKSPAEETERGTYNSSFFSIIQNIKQEIDSSSEYEIPKKKKRSM